MSQRQYDDEEGIWQMFSSWLKEHLEAILLNLNILPIRINMTKKESDALKKAGVKIGKIRYYNISEVSLSCEFLLKFDIKSWPDVPKEIGEWGWPGTNTSIFGYKGKRIGLTHCSDNDSISVSLSHPLSDYWLSILQPIWDEQNVGKCGTCNGSGWDGIGYVFGCIDCSGSGKK